MIFSLWASLCGVEADLKGGGDYPFPAIPAKGGLQLFLLRAFAPLREFFENLTQRRKGAKN